MIPSPLIVGLTCRTLNSLSARSFDSLVKPQLVADVRLILLRVLHSLRIVCSDIEERLLLCGMLAQFSHLIDTACNTLLLFSLIPALCFVPLSLLPCVFFLALCKC